MTKEEKGWMYKLINDIEEKAKTWPESLCYQIDGQERIKQINQVLIELHKAWTKHPELRLGQLIANSLHNIQPCNAVFYVKDEDLIKHLAKYDEK